jgi:RNA recognition motif-containing protein
MNNLQANRYCMKIKIFNLSQDINDSALERMFLPYGVVNSAVVSRNSLNGRSNCNGIVEMPLEKQAQQAIMSLDRTVVSGKIISVAEHESRD